MTGIAYESKMSDTEALMWRLERDPHLSSTFGNVSIFDRTPDFDQLRRRMERAALVIPRLRQVVRSGPGNLAAPRWIDDSEFDIDRHLRRVALPAPADVRVLLDYANAIVGDPFDRTRPLWQFTVVEGLQGGRAALIQKLHHTIADGESGVQLSLEFLDFERDAAPPGPTDPDVVAEVSSDIDEDPTAVAVRDLLEAFTRLPVGVANRTRELLTDPTQIPEAGRSAAETVHGIATQLGETDGARSPLWTARSLGRHLEAASVPLDSTKAAAKALGGTLNTAFMSIATHAVGRYHAEFGHPVDELRASMALSTRTDASGANAFSLVRMLVPTGEMPIAERFVAIRDTTDAAVDQARTAPLDAIAAFTSTLPTSVVTSIVRQQAQTVDFATSNVRGSPIPVFLAGAQMLSNVPIGPLTGVAFNLTLLSYEGRLDMGLHTDRSAVTEPDMLRRFIEEAADELAETVE